MTFLEKLDYMMSVEQINKRGLSALSGVPYTTIDGLYKKGFENTKMQTIKKLAAALGVSLDYLMVDSIEDPEYGKTFGFKFQNSEVSHIKKYRTLDAHGKDMVDTVLQKEHARMLSEEQDLKEDAGIIYLMHNSEKASAGKGFYLDGHEQMDRWAVELNELTRQADFCVDIQGDSMEPRFSDGDTVLVRSQPSVNIGEIGLFAVDGAGYIKRQRADVLESINENYEDIPLDTNMTIKCFGKVIGILEDEWIVEK